jgi:hypothetical protein
MIARQRIASILAFVLFIGMLSALTSCSHKDVVAPASTGTVDDHGGHGGDDGTGDDHGAGHG